MRYKKHVFICTNERSDGRDCCGENHGKELAAAMKLLVKDRGLKDIRINKSGCLDVCAYGPAVVIYPEAIWYGDVQPDDVEEIVTSHLQDDVTVERLQIDFKKSARKWLRDHNKR